MRDKHWDIFNQFSSTFTAETVQKWENAILEWTVDRTKHNPYEEPVSCKFSHPLHRFMLFTIDHQLLLFKMFDLSLRGRRLLMPLGVPFLLMRSRSQPSLQWDLILRNSSKLQAFLFPYMTDVNV
jgi:hypothetical protein